MVPSPRTRQPDTSLPVGRVGAYPTAPPGNLPRRALKNHFGVRARGRSFTNRRSRALTWTVGTLGAPLLLFAILLLNPALVSVEEVTPNVHLTLMMLGAAVAAGIGVVALLTHLLNGRRRPFMVGAGLLGFSTFYVWHAIFTHPEDPFKFLIFGSIARAWFAAFVLALGADVVFDPQRRRRNTLAVAFATITLSSLGYFTSGAFERFGESLSPFEVAQTLRAVEILALFLAVAATIRLALSEQDPEDLRTATLLIGAGLLSEASFFFIFSTPWTPLWWFSHFLNGSAILLVAISVLADWRSAEEEQKERTHAEQLLRQREAQMAEAERLAHLGSWEWDHATGQLRWSDELFRILDLPPQPHNASFETFLVRAHPEDRERVRITIRESQRIGRSFSLEHRVARGDGTIRYLQTDGHALRSNGNLVRTFGIVQDITGRVEAERSLREALRKEQEVQRLKEIDRVKTSFLSTAAHELNTPLTPIKLQLDAFKKYLSGGLSEPQQHALALLDRNVDRLTMLIKDLLEASRIQADRLSLRRARVDLNRLVAESVESFGASARNAQVQLVFHGTPDLWVSADPFRIGQVLSNLLSNAIKFTPAGGQVTVEAFREGTNAVVRVQDTGAGIRREDLDKLFTPFTQLHTEGGETRPGTGLGLYIVRGIVEQHGGHVGVESEGLGHGTRFTFALSLEGVRTGAPERPPNPVSSPSDPASERTPSSATP